MNGRGAILLACACAAMIVALYATGWALLTAGVLFVQLLTWVGGGAVYAAGAWVARSHG